MDLLNGAIYCTKGVTNLARGNIIERYECPICKKDYKQTKSYKSHLKKEHRIGE